MEDSIRRDSAVRLIHPGDLQRLGGPSAVAAVDRDLQRAVPERLDR